MNIETALRGAGLRPTLARTGVLQVLHETDALMHADGIFLQLGRIRRGIGLGTVYRALKVLEQHRLILREWGEDGATGRKALYRLRSGAPTVPAVRLVCRACQRQFDVDDHALAQHLQQAAARSGLALAGPPLTLHVDAAACPACVCT